MRYLSTIVVVFSVFSMAVGIVPSGLSPTLVSADEEPVNPVEVQEDLQEGDVQGEAHDKEGPPLGIEEDLVIWSFVTFLLFLLVLGKFAWTPLNEGLKQREIGIRENIAAAETARLSAEKMLADHKQQLASTQDQVKEIIAEAHRDADEVRQKLMAAAQRDVEGLRQRTLEDLERAKNQAIKELFDNMSEQVAIATEHVLGRALQAEDQNRLIDEALAQLPAKG
ncbi:F0F1 ATP synthase subunit B [Polystyrenella longa]|uniref:F0F1 ATP synthase subunit B n=1 Tax=Polystyrenella longa TaxID=2528007 RepID=UPI0011A1BFEC|nr:F0F1 ATP synthase subunit B [Polystyrenella longa]